MCPVSNDAGNPLQVEAYELAIVALKKVSPTAARRPQVIDAVMSAVVDLANRGQRDVDVLARYAASRGRAVENALNHRVTLR